MGFIKNYKVAIISFFIYAIIQIFFIPLILYLFSDFLIIGIGFPMFQQFETLIDDIIYTNRFIFIAFVINIVVPLILATLTGLIFKKIRK